MIVVFMFGEMGAANRISVFYAIFHPNDRTVQLMMSTVDDAIGAAIYGWAYVLCPPIASLPVISYYCDSRTSGYCDFLETRDGRRKYVARLFFSIFISAFLVTMLSYVFYVIVCLIRFPLNPVAPDGFIIQFIGYEEQTVFDVIKDSFARFLLFAVYAGAVSALGMIIAFLYPKRYFVLSIMFIAGHIMNFVIYFHDWKAILLCVIIMIPSAALIIEGSRGGFIKI